MRLPPGDFESPASTSFTTPAHAERYFHYIAVSRVLECAQASHGVAPAILLDAGLLFDNISRVGVVAQLGEHLSGRQEVTGSIPVNSTFLYPVRPRNRVR
jgi:hypothetical protein